MKFAKWIWENKEDHADEYVCFYDTFEVTEEKVCLEISCDSNYELYVNGGIVAFGQYADFPYYKVYDRVDISPYCKKGKNQICILVWYYGADFSTYYKGRPCLIYEIKEGERVIAFSDETTLCRKTTDYLSGVKKIITVQLGYSYSYDMRAYDGWREENFIPTCFSPAVLLQDHPQAMFERPIEKLRLKSFQKAEKIEGTADIYDLGKETVGYLAFRLKAPRNAQINISYGEHLVEKNGISCVPRKIGGRDFSMDFVANGEWFDFANYMRRLGGRYLQITCDAPVEVDQIGLYPAEYPVNVLPVRFDSPLRQKIYDTAVHTLRCCMFEHYEDCPWREQALYNVDSRNQMLCGYYAFGEYRFARASLDLMGRDQREDGLLHICFPSKIDLVIPFFSLIYVIQMQEYAEYSGDDSLLAEYYERMQRILQAFDSFLEDGLVCNLQGQGRYWNFYEWSPTLDGSDSGLPKQFDLMLNSAYVMATDKMAVISEKLGLDEDAEKYRKLAEYMRKNIHDRFYDREKGLYCTTLGLESCSQLANAFAILCKAADRDTAISVCKKIISRNDMVPASLSMKAFLYDALLQTDRQTYMDWVLDDIDLTYSYMLDQGATTFWETLKGAEDFENAGSLCHGWSAIPVIYYHKLLL